MNNLKDKRNEKGMTQQQAGDALGITQTSLSYYELGKRQPKPAMLVKMARLYGCTVDELLADPKEER